VSTAGAFSTSFNPPALSLKRLLGNYLAFELSGLAHTRVGPRTALLTRTTSVTSVYVAGAANFCKSCLKKLEKLDPAKVNRCSR